MLKVAVTDISFEKLDVEEAILKPLGCEIVVRQCKTQEELIELTRDADCVVTQFAKINAAVLAAMTRARVIVRYGIGVDNIDLDAARERGIPVCNVPDYCIDEVADHALAMILSLTRAVVPVSNHIRAGQSGLPVALSAYRNLSEMTAGVVGFGRIGREVCARLKAFKCAVNVFDPVVQKNVIERSGYAAVDFDELLKSSDVLTLHCPSNAKTRKLLNSSTFEKMKTGALLVNVARGDLVDATALVAALKSGKVAAAGLDVFESEPFPKDHPILQLPNVVLSPHVACASVNAIKRLREGVAHHVARALRGETLTCVVNGVSEQVATK
jgi:D-3-phosphoglycerate dehydrogenase